MSGLSRGEVPAMSFMFCRSTASSPLRTWARQPACSVT